MGTVQRAAQGQLKPVNLPSRATSRQPGLVRVPTGLRPPRHLASVHPSLLLPSAPPPAPALLMPFILPPEKCIFLAPRGPCRASHGMGTQEDTGWEQGPWSTQLAHMSPLRRGREHHPTLQMSKLRPRGGSVHWGRGPRTLVGIPSLPAPSTDSTGARDGL